MNRKLFLRNAFMSIAISLVPKILQPVEVEIVSEDLPESRWLFHEYMDSVPKIMYWYFDLAPNGTTRINYSTKPLSSTITLNNHSN